MESIEGMMHLHMLGVGMVVFRILILLNPFITRRSAGVTWTATPGEQHSYHLIRPRQVVFLALVRVAHCYTMKLCCSAVDTLGAGSVSPWWICNINWPCQFVTNVVTSISSISALWAEKVTCARDKKSHKRSSRSLRRASRTRSQRCREPPVLGGCSLPSALGWGGARGNGVDAAFNLLRCSSGVWRGLACWDHHRFVLGSWGLAASPLSNRKVCPGHRVWWFSTRGSVWRHLGCPILAEEWIASGM